MDVDEFLFWCLFCYNFIYELIIICFRSMMMYYEFGLDSCYMDDMYGEDFGYSFMYYQLVDIIFGIFREVIFVLQLVIK